LLLLIFRIILLISTYSSEIIKIWIESFIIEKIKDLQNFLLFKLKNLNLNYSPTISQSFII